MKIFIKSLFLLYVLTTFKVETTYAENPLKFRPSINYYKDLSDTFGGGNLLIGEIQVLKDLYGISGGFGHFQSQSTFLLKVPVAEINSILQIPIEEMTIMQIGTFSGLIKPINKKWFTADILFGICLNKSKSLFSKDVMYTYNISEHMFTELIKDYQLINKSRFGYQLGLDLSFYPFQKAGFQISARIQDLRKGGSFFFVGGGFCFNL